METPDTDGITSTKEVYGYLKLFTENVDYILNQREEGHGVIPNKVNPNTKLLIIVDSSTNSVNECKELSERGVDIIIIDHHNKDVENPYATIVNPQTCDYPNKSLSGSAVCWQFLRAFDIINGIEFANDFVDLACVGLVGDMMSMMPMENRYIAWAGLMAIHNKMGNKGLYKLFKELGKDYKPTTQDISYYIAPCLNAIIRLDDINILMDLFNTEEDDILKLICKEIKQKNEDRKRLTDEIVNSLEGKLNDDKITIVDMTDSGFKKAMFGLIANKISREKQKPTFVGKIENGEFYGSGRGFGDEIKLKETLFNSGLFNLVAGHENSFGVKFNIDKLQDIKDFANKEFANLYNEQFAEYDIEIEYEDMSEFNLKLMDDISVICGQGFPRPNFLIRGLVIDECKKIGKEQNHTKLTKKDDMNLDIMKFNTTESLEKYENSDYVDVIGNIGLNEFGFGANKKLTKQVLADIINCEVIDI